MPYIPMDFIEVGELEETERGAGGFGSTGEQYYQEGADLMGTALAIILGAITGRIIYLIMEKFLW